MREAGLDLSDRVKLLRKSTICPGSVSWHLGRTVDRRLVAKQGDLHLDQLSLGGMDFNRASLGVSIGLRQVLYRKTLVLGLWDMRQVD